MLGESCILHPQQEEISHLISQSAFEHLSDQKQIKTNLNCNFFMIPACSYMKWSAMTLITRP